MICSSNETLLKLPKMLTSRKLGAQSSENRALDALLAGLGTVVKQAARELGCYATEEAIVSRATKKLGCEVMKTGPELEPPRL